MELIRGLSAMLPLWASLLIVPATGLAVFGLLDWFFLELIRKYSPGIDSTTPALLALLAMTLAGIAVFAGQMERSKRGKLFAQTQQLADLRHMSWRDFERLVADTYRKLGYQVTERGGPSPDGGVDLEIIDHEQRKGLVQCKQWKSSKVGVKPVRELLGVLAKERAQFAIIITCGEFTRESLVFAVGQPISLIEGSALIDMLQTARHEHPFHSDMIENIPEAAKDDVCLLCGKQLTKRTARRGQNSGALFMGCTGFPACRYTRNLD